VSTNDAVRQVPKPSTWLRFRSGYVDRAVAAVTVVIVAPVLAVLAGVVRWREGPPALVKLMRVGTEGSQFPMWKLRTMRADHPGGRAAGVDITARADARITPTGRWLRRWRLDELPQLINVIRGDMALLGPRPESPALVDLEDPRWRVVLATRPGIAGPTQLAVEAWEADVLDGDDHQTRYRTEILPVKLAVDRWYVEAATPLLDLTVAVSMVERFVLGRADTWVQAVIRRAVPAAAAIPRAAERR
jgi:lipopolysaccharide/colanic/teichoic acid biosynthesis glycosyltransferase